MGNIGIGSINNTRNISFGNRKTGGTENGTIFSVLKEDVSSETKEVKASAGIKVSDDFSKRKIANSYVFDMKNFTREYVTNCDKQNNYSPAITLAHPKIDNGKTIANTINVIEPGVFDPSMPVVRICASDEKGTFEVFINLKEINPESCSEMELYALDTYFKDQQINEGVSKSEVQGLPIFQDGIKAQATFNNETSNYSYSLKALIELAKANGIVDNSLDERIQKLLSELWGE